MYHEKENKIESSGEQYYIRCEIHFCFKQVKENFPRGATLHLEGDFSQLSREDIKEKFNSLGYETAFVAFNKGEKEAHIRLGRENSGKEVKFVNNLNNRKF